MKEIELLFKNEKAEELQVLFQVINERSLGFFNKTNKYTMAISLIEDLHNMGYKIVKQR